MYAYDENMCYYGQNALAWTFDTAVNWYKVELDVFYQMFLNSIVSKRFAEGDPFIIMGKSGHEIAADILVENVENFQIRPNYYTLNRSSEYWLGGSLAYYQWYKGIPFSQITEDVSILDYQKMYSKYHEMDMMHFVNDVDEMRRMAKHSSRLKRFRMYAGLSQKELADICGVPLRTIQQYEQRQKDINRANVDYVLRLSKALHCELTALLEEEY